MGYPSIDLVGAVVAITGGAQGIGRATAQLFAEHGALVAIGDLDASMAQQAALDFGGSGHHLDVSDAASFREFVSEVVGLHGPIDVLVNNAGVMPNGHFLDLADEINRLTVDVNLFGVANGMRAVLPSMIQRGRGHIVNVASLAGKFPVKGLAIYNASKYAVVGLSASTRLEYADRGISVTAVLPSAVDTALASGLDMRPLPKVRPEQIAAAIVASVQTRKGEIAVPSYVGRLAGLSVFTPESVQRVVRRLIRDDRALQPDSDERRDYRRGLERRLGDPP